MLVADTLIDAVGHRYLLFMNGYAKYYRLIIVVPDCHKTAFRCPESIGTFEWTAMPFGLKNAPTYQRTMNFIFHDMIGKSMEIYIDDIVAKSHQEGDHLENLRQALESMRRYNLKMNPLKCAFGVQAWNFLGFLVHN